MTPDQNTYNIKTQNKSVGSSETIRIGRLSENKQLFYALHVLNGDQMDLYKQIRQNINY